jgi:membrane-bound ClpP family serine protease
MGGGWALFLLSKVLLALLALGAVFFVARLFPRWRWWAILGGLALVALLVLLMRGSKWGVVLLALGLFFLLSLLERPKGKR